MARLPNGWSVYIEAQLDRSWWLVDWELHKFWVRSRRPLGLPTLRVSM